MPKRGSWGDRMEIITPILYKRVTCATCINYCHEDLSCLVSPIVPAIDGFDYWKKCKRFTLSPEYCDDKHKAQVKREKGEMFFLQQMEKTDVNKGRQYLEREDLCVNENINCGKIPKNVPEVSKTFADRFITSAWNNHKIEFQEIAIPVVEGVANSKCFVNNYEKMIAMTMPKVKNRYCKNQKITQDFIKKNRWSCFFNNLKAIIQLIRDLENTDEYEKWIVVPEIIYEKDKSCGEVFYQTKGKLLQGIKLVELGEDNILQFATGPIQEKYWTAERINNLEIFKQ